MASPAQKPPVGVRELTQLTNHGVTPQTINYLNVNIQSQRFVTVKEDQAVAIIDVTAKSVSRLPVPVDSAIMHPTSKVIALRAGKNVQIFSLEMRSKLKATVIEQPIVFWKWIDTKTIAIVTETSVLHWSIEGQDEPKEIFTRLESAGVQVLNYRKSDDGNFLMLSGIKSAAAGGGVGGVSGVLQVYSVAAKTSQRPVDSHAACFTSLTLDGRTAPSTLFCFSMTIPGQQNQVKLNVLELGQPQGQTPFTSSALVDLAQGDFPLALVADPKHGVLFLLTKSGVLYLYEIVSGKRIFATKASQVNVFTTADYDGPEGGFVAVDQKGAIRHFHADDSAIVPYITSTLGDVELGVQMAQRYNLPGAEGLFRQTFQRLMASGEHEKAIQLAASAPQGVLRNLETMNALKTGTPNGAGLLQYFRQLLGAGKLNAVESVELVKPLLAKGPDAIERVTLMLREQQLEASEELGDILQRFNVTLALSVFLRANVPEKVISCFMSLGAQETDEAKAQEYFNNILSYAEKASYSADYAYYLDTLVKLNPARAVSFALLLVLHPSGPKVDPNRTADIFYQNGDVKSCTRILLEYLRSRGDREEDAALQTKLLEINLLTMPQAADMILGSDSIKLSHYDRLKVAQLCERAQLYARALEHYTDLADIKRCLAAAAAMNVNPQFLVGFFGRLSPEASLDCLRDMLKFNLQGNIRLVVDVAKAWSDHMGADKLIELFEEFNSTNGLFFYLQSLVNTTDNKNVVFKYLQAAVKLQQIKEVERVCRELSNFDAKEVKEYLLHQNLKEPRPLIYVCDRFGFVEELATYLYNNKLHTFIEAYVHRINNAAAPQVVGALLDLNAPDDMIKKLIGGVRIPPEAKDFSEKLIESCETRNRLKLLRSWLEERRDEGSQETAIHNGLAKIYVDVNNNPQHFLQNNRFYDSKVVGVYCESRDPHLSFIAYKRAGGSCDDLLVDVACRHGFFKDLARYLVERQDQALWANVLAESNPHRRPLIDQVVATALPESRVADEVSATLQAFIAAQMPAELLELLERIVLHGSPDGEFATNPKLQKLLIVTAVKADKARVMEYLKRLEHYDGPAIAEILLHESCQMYEEAFYVYQKIKMGPAAIKVLLDNLDNIQRATEFADFWNEPDVWSLLAKAQLRHDLVKESIASFLKATDASEYEAVIKASNHAGCFAELIQFIQMARSKVKDAQLDNQLIYSYAKTDRLADMEDFINQTSLAKLQDVGEQCFSEQLFKAAAIIFRFNNNNAKLAICLVKLGQFQEAVDAARKANAIPTWKAVCFACVEAEKFRLAQQCAINIIAYMEHLLEVVRFYETRGYFEEIIAVLEQGIVSDRAHQGIFTQLGVLYCKYKEDKLMEHIKLYHSKLNIPQLLSECQRNLHWSEAVYLLTHYDQYDNALNTLIAHAADCWTHELFKEVLSHVANTELYYRAIDFYVQQHPLLLNELLIEMSGRTLDHSRVVLMFKTNGCMPLIQRYLLHVQKDNLTAVNEAVNALFVEEENVKGLRDSVDSYASFDQLSLAQLLEKHELLEFRRIAAYLFKGNKRYDRSIELSKKDKIWGDAMETAAESKDRKLAEQLLDFFVNNGQKECVAATLYACYELIRPDVVLEISWRFNMTHFVMPYMIQTFRDYDDKLSALATRLDNFEKSSHEKEVKKEEDKPADAASFASPPVHHAHGGHFAPSSMPLALPPSQPAPLALMPAGYVPHHAQGPAGFHQPGFY